MIIIYLLLCILTVLFSRSFFSDALKGGQVPGLLNLIVFFTIPVVLLVFLVISTLNLFGDIIARRTGSKFKARLLAYFIVIVVFAAAPITLVTGLSISEIVRFWKSTNSDEALEASRRFAVDVYSFHIENFETLLKRADFESFVRRPEVALPEGLAAIQDFTQDQSGNWTEAGFTGK
ncbi:MAG: sensor histidine kinase, partial [Treponema sp.]|nr:sensor histidine kinase [Treponema sp.]